VDKQLIEGDRLYLIAESLAQDFSLFPTTESEEPLPGLLPESQIVQQTEHLGSLYVDSYIDLVGAPA